MKLKRSTIITIGAICLFIAINVWVCTTIFGANVTPCEVDQNGFCVEQALGGNHE